jgi:hypothetical protein
MSGGPQDHKILSSMRPGEGSNMGGSAKIARVVFIVATLVVYLTVAWFGVTEESRRSLAIVKSSSTSLPEDYVIVDIAVTSIEQMQGLMHERIMLIPKGKFAIDAVTPAVDLKFFINSISGRQTIIFPKGERIIPMDFITLLPGNQNRYPFDRYVSNIDLLITTRAVRVAPPPQPVPDVSDSNPSASALTIAQSDLEHNEPIPIRESFTASIPGSKFVGSADNADANTVMHTAVKVRRANSVIVVSVVIQIVMFLLAISIMSMVLAVIASKDAINLLPLSLCVTLIFGLPALRNVQPGVPPVGALCDFLSFMWAEFIVTTSAIVLAWIWALRSRRDRRQQALEH